MSEEHKDFKVVDRRFTATESDAASQKPTSAEDRSGPGFVMKEKPPADEPVTPTRIDFSTLIFSLATGALINLGLAPDPSTQKVQKNLELAKQNIDILSMLQAKTKGNLTEDERGLLENLLAETQLRYVEASRKA